MKISIIGAGYVGMALFSLLITKHDVMICDIDSRKIMLIDQKKSPIQDLDVQNVLEQFTGTFKTTTKTQVALRHGEIVFICVPTDFDMKLNHFDTSRIDHILNQGISLYPDTTFVIKSTVPVGYTAYMKKIWKTDKIVFSPEFLREDKALYDNWYPSRIIVGDLGSIGQKIAKILRECAIKKNVKTHLTSSTEAEAIKLFSNTYLAMRVAFFNELDTFSELHELDAKRVITGVGLDSRIGLGYNNPSFGYGGYCLPKDTKQLLANYNWIPQNLIKAIVSANETRKDHISQMIMEKEAKIIGIYRLTMKKNSDNIRESAILGIINRLKDYGREVIIYEPLIGDQYYKGCPVIHDLDKFKQSADLIVCNRRDIELEDVKHKVYTRDVFVTDL